jgi:ANTH domain
MSHVDAEEALKLYRHFCGQTEKVVEFLGVAKKLQNLLNVPIPNLKHVRIPPLLPVHSFNMYAGPSLSCRRSPGVFGGSQL